MIKKFALLFAVTFFALQASDVFAGKGGSGGGSRPSFGGGSRSVAAPSGGKSGVSSRPSFGGGSSSGNQPTASATKPSVAVSPPNKVVSNTPIVGKTPTSVSKKPIADSFDKVSATEAKKIDSRKAYEKAEAPKETYKTPAGKEVKIDPKDKQIGDLRSRLDEQRWVNRSQRQDSFYGGYSARPVVIYNDPFHPMWNYYLASQTMDVMSLWMFHHSMQMDASRREAMYSQNAELRVRVAALERQGMQRDPSYAPTGVDPDLMYQDDYVNAVYNPRPKTQDEYEYDAPSVMSAGHVLLWIFVYIPVMIFGVVLLYWLLFCFEW